MEKKENANELDNFEEVDNKSKSKFIIVMIAVIFLITGVLIVGGVIAYSRVFKAKSNKNTDDVIPVSPNQGYIAKPVIYLYPEEETVISVKLGNPEKLTCVYPNYNDGWIVKAYPNGTLVDEQAGRTYYSLYYESNSTKKYNENLEEGFVIKKENIVEFLEEKLAILGLNDRETEEFIIYWLPRLQQNNYIYVRFETMEEIEENMPLIISQNPDTLIRILMEWKGLNEYTNVKEQLLNPVTRNGYTVVEWGGTEIK